MEKTICEDTVTGFRDSALGPAEGFPPLPNIEVLMFAWTGETAEGIAREIVQAVESEARYPALK